MKPVFINAVLILFSIFIILTGCDFVSENFSNPVFDDDSMTDLDSLSVKGYPDSWSMRIYKYNYRDDGTPRARYLEKYYFYDGNKPSRHKSFIETSYNSGDWELFYTDTFKYQLGNHLLRVTREYADSTYVTRWEFFFDMDQQKITYITEFLEYYLNGTKIVRELTHRTIGYNSQQAIIKCYASADDDNYYYKKVISVWPKRTASKREKATVDCSSGNDEWERTYDYDSNGMLDTIEYEGPRGNGTEKFNSDNTTTKFQYEGEDNWMTFHKYRNIINTSVFNPYDPLSEFFLYYDTPDWDYTPQ